MNNTNANAYAIYKRPTRKGQVRYYRHDSNWRLRLMSKAVAQLDLETGAAVLVEEKPFSLYAR